MSNRENPPETQDDVLYGVSPSVLENIRIALDIKRYKHLRFLLKELHAADVADVMLHLNTAEREVFLEAIKGVFDPNILIELEPSVLQHVLEVLDVDALAKAISGLNSDDALYIIEDLKEEKRQKLLLSLPAKDRVIFEKYLTYPEQSAGRLMQREIVCVPPFWNTQQTLDFIRDTAELPQNFYDIYVVDPRHHPVGKIPLSHLVKASRDKTVSEIMTEEIHTIPVLADQEEVALSFNHYALVSAPVVNEEGRIVGMITVDDVVEVIEEEIEEDIRLMSKVSAASDFYDPVLLTAGWRIRWLLITIVNTLIASYVISRFENSIQNLTALSFLMTINAAMGGNAGMQVVTVVVRALATRTLRESDTWRAIRKEVNVSLLVGLFCSLVLALIAGAWLDNWGISLVLGISLIFNILWAGFAGTFLPIFIEKLGMDPAISAGPLLTTTTDVFGYTIFLGLATLFLL